MGKLCSLESMIYVYKIVQMYLEEEKLKQLSLNFITSHNTFLQSHFLRVIISLRVVL